MEAEKKMKMKQRRGVGRKRGMCLVLGCGAEEERVVATHQAPGSCPCCGGAVVATDVEKPLRLCFLPMCLKTTRKFSCTGCSRRLVAVCP